MFFNRKQPPTTSATPDVLTGPTSAHAEADPRWQVAGRRAVALGMAVQLALPVASLTAFARSARAAGLVGTKGSGSSAPISGATDSVNGSDAALRKMFGVAADGTPAVPTLSASADAAALKAFGLAIDHLRAGEYDQAAAAILAVPTAGLSDADVARLDVTLGKARDASHQQQKARAELSVAQQAAGAGEAVQAAQHYQLAGSNVFADADTRRQAGDGALRLLGGKGGASLLAPPIQADVIGGGAPANTVALVTTEQDAPAATAPTTAPAADATPAPAAVAPTPATAPVADATPAPVAPATAAVVPTPATTPAADATPTPPAVVPAPPVTPTPAPAAVAPMPAPVAAVPPAPPAMPDEQSVAQKALASASNYQRIKEQLQQYQATKLVEKARVEYGANQLHDALADYTEAARLDPLNQQAVSGRDETASKLGVGLTRPLDKSQGVIKERIEQIKYQFNSDLQKADEATTVERFTDAQKAIDDARVARNVDPTLFTPQQLNEFDTRISNAEVGLQKAQAKKQDTDIRTSTDKTLATDAERRRRFELEKQQTVESLIQSARQYYEQGQYQQSLAAIDQIIRIDPTNQYAVGTRQMVADKAIAAEQRLYRERFDREFEKTLNAADETLIPYNDIVRYADDWPSLSEQRDKEVQADRGEGDQDTALQAQLDRHLPEVRFNANALSDVIDFLRDVTGANIYVDWKALEAASIARDAPVTARLRDIKFSKALELIFKSVNGDDDEHKLGYTVDEGVITISTRKELNKNTVTRRYDINDLLFVPPDYNNAPQLDLQSSTNNQSAGGSGGGGGGGGGQSLFSGNTQQDNTSQANNREQRIDEIKQYIQQNVDANSWKDAGGDVGTVSSSPLRAILLITQTPENQHKIVSVLDSLRASQALQVSIETRFLTVQRNFLEDIGVDADLTFNPLTDPSNPRSGYNSSRFSPITISQNQVTDNSTFTDANGNVVASGASGSRNLDWASEVGNSSVPGSIAANPADYPNPIVIRGSYLDNLTVSFLIRAVEANVHSTTLTAPRLTLFSGQRSVLIVETQQAYVSDVTPVVAPGAALFDPTVSTTVAVGVVLSVQATVSPDRKYVFLDLQPQLARLRALASFTISAVVQQTSTVVGGAATSQVVSGTIQLPTIDVTQVRTSVSVPDGATLLLGGQTLAGETTREQGVPVLSKIPFVKRLFTNRANGQDEQILLILVKPTILIQREQEQKQFPQLSSKLTGTGT